MASKSHFLYLIGDTFKRKEPSVRSPELFLSTVSNNASEHMRLHLCFAANYQPHENIPWKIAEDAAHSPFGKIHFYSGKEVRIALFLAKSHSDIFLQLLFSPMKILLPPNRGNRRGLRVISAIWPIICRFNDRVLHRANHFLIATKRRILIGQCNKVTPQLKSLYLRVRAWAIWSTRSAFTEKYTWYRFIITNYQITIVFF